MKSSSQLQPPSKAFVKLASWLRALRELLAGLGVKIEDGEIHDLPGGGRAFKFETSRAAQPFDVSSSGYIRGGLLFHAGRVFYFPDRQFTPITDTWTIGITIPVEWDTVNNGGSPWDIHLSSGAADPTVEIKPLGYIGTNSGLRDTDPAGTETIVDMDGEIFWPLASFDGTRVIKHRDDVFHYGQLLLYFKENGRQINALPYTGIGF